MEFTQLYILGAVMFFGYMIQQFSESRKTEAFIIFALIAASVWPISFAAYLILKSMDKAIFG